MQDRPQVIGESTKINILLLLQELSPIWVLSLSEDLGLDAHFRCFVKIHDAEDFSGS